MSLTIDVGNSRVKWAEWQAGEIVASGAGVYDKKNLPASLDALLVDLKKTFSHLFCLCCSGRSSLCSNAVGKTTLATGC